MVDDKEALEAALLLRAVEGDAPPEGEEGEVEGQPHYDAALYADESDADEAGVLDSHERLLYEAMAAADQSVSPSTSSNTSSAPHDASSHDHVGGLLCDAHQHTAKGDPQPASRKLHFRQTHDDAPSFAADDAAASFAPVDSSSGLAYREEAADMREYDLKIARQRFTHNVIDGAPSAPRPPPPTDASLDHTEQTAAVRVALYDTTLHPIAHAAPIIPTTLCTTDSAFVCSSAAREGPELADARALVVASAPPGPDAQSVWSNLAAIFQDIDKGGSEVRTPELARPLAQLRRLLHLHNELRREEHDLRKAHLGLLVEAGWHLEKLREIEATLVSQSGDSASTLGGDENSDGGGGGGGGGATDEQLSRTLQRILLEEAPGFKRVSSALQPMAPHVAHLEG